MIPDSPVLAPISPSTLQTTASPNLDKPVDVIVPSTSNISLLSLSLTDKPAPAPASNEGNAALHSTQDTTPSTTTTTTPRKDKGYYNPVRSPTTAITSPVIKKPAMHISLPDRGLQQPTLNPVATPKDNPPVTPMTLDGKASDGEESHDYLS